MSDKGKDKRTQSRIKVDELPENLRELVAFLPKEKCLDVETTDASLNGFGFKAHAHLDDFILGLKIALNPCDEECFLFGTIVHAQKIDEDTVRVGIKLLHSHSYEKYKSIIEGILKVR